MKKKTSNFKASVVQWKAHDAVGPSSSLMGIISFLESTSSGRPEFDSCYLFMRWQERPCLAQTDGCAQRKLTKERIRRV
jgi:hypothetical protein